MYEVDNGWWFVPNPLKKFTVSPRNKLKYNPDGSLTLYFQNESPGKEKQANWLPAPTGEFIPMLRMYWPKETPPTILDGSWKPPPVRGELLIFGTNQQFATDRLARPRPDGKGDLRCLGCEVAQWFRPDRATQEELVDF
jgi:hypothetical protein